MPRLLIAGLGSIGRRHLDNLRSLGVDDFVLYRQRPEPLPQAPALPVFNDLDKALATRPDLVIVATPTACHLTVALPAARRGLNLFIEKPVADNWAGVDELLDLVKTQRLLSMVGFDLRFDPGLQKAKELLQSGSIGRVVSVQCQVGQYLPEWRPGEDYRKGSSARTATGGGVILDLIHELDYVAWLIGPVSQVSCFADRTSSLEIETEDVAEIILRFASGAIGSVHLDYIQRIPSRTCRLVGEEGTILWDYFGSSLCWFQTQTKGWQTFSYPGFQRNDRFVAEMRHVLACLRGEEQPRVDLAEGSRSLKLALAAKESARTGKLQCIQ
jgi:predicted dehydrogenase